MLALDVVVRTLADAARSESLFRALDSIQNQQGIDARPIVVVNGDRRNPKVLEKLEHREGILLHYIPQASAGMALVEGRRRVTAEYFAFLDDDDTLVADSLRGPVGWIEGHPECDVVISNGYFVKDGGVLSEYIHVSDHLRVGQPALSLIQDGWFAPGAFVCRSSSIPLRLVDFNWNHMEWTHIAFELCAAGKKLCFMDVPTVLYHDSPGSLSKKSQQTEAALDLMQAIRSDARMSPEVRTEADRKYHNILHILAMQGWEQGDARKAWRYHLASMQPPHTFRYLLFTRKLLWRRGALS